MSGDRTLLEQIVLDEVADKNQAIHAYDRILWIVRSGYLTILGAGSALVLTSLLDRGEIAKSSRDLLLALIFVLAGLSLGGLAVEMNYTRRKFPAYHLYRNLEPSNPESWGLLARVPADETSYVDLDFDGTRAVEYLVIHAAELRFGYEYEGAVGAPIRVDAAAR